MGLQSRTDESIPTRPRTLPRNSISQPFATTLFYETYYETDKASWFLITHVQNARVCSFGERLSRLPTMILRESCTNYQNTYNVLAPKPSEFSKAKTTSSSSWSRSSDLGVMSPARFLCAMLLKEALRFAYIMGSGNSGSLAAVGGDLPFYTLF
ncbi:hypothetical protein FIBSPDRAFT_158724 [Athelia psychrophila]|uniref:Uncharacterized protein n=1 Tax=Athelia psychrophila TaxID=1759441 RepID=A0A166B8T5_9AGAM|nr:hypothetical protein FIBSPDRAFT_158724 [Fibularhizoctonia sp. CBS 109695]